jgi:hypothetical protein
MRSLRKLLFLMALLAGTSTAFAQSPNNAALVVLVVDQTGGVVAGANVSVTNSATSAARDAVSSAEGTATFSALPLDGAYAVTVTKTGFVADEITGLRLRASEVSTVRVKLVATGGKSEVTVYGTEQGVRANSQIGRRFDSATIDETPILGRKVTTVPLFNSAFRQGKGTGDLFVNATYFITGGGSRRATTYMLDGANNDEGWGRQTMVATVPVGAIKELSALTNAFSAEFGWTSGPALNIVTKSGANTLHGEALYLGRPGRWQAKTFGTTGFCPPTVPSCVTPSTLTAINPADVPDVLNQYSASIGGAFVRDKTFFFATGDYTAQNRTTFLSSTLPSFVLIDGRLEYEGHYRQKLFNGRLDQTVSPKQSLMFRTNVDTFFDTNPNDAVVGTNAPSVARRYSRSSITGQINHTYVVSSTLLNEVRASYVHGDPVTRWESQNLSTTYTRAGSAPFTIGESRQSDIYSKQAQLQNTLTWSTGRHTLRVGASAARHISGGTGSEPGQATLGTFTFVSSTTAPFDQLTLANVQSYSQPISYGITGYEFTQWLLAMFAQDTVRFHNDLTLDLGLRYDRQTLTDATTNFAPRVGFGWHPRGDARTAIRGGYGLYYTQIRANAVASALTGGLDGLTTYSAVPGQTGFPTCLTGACLPLNFDPRTLPASQRPARNITLRAGDRQKYVEQFAAYGLNFAAIAGSYPDELVNPRSQVTSIGVEREVVRGLFIGGDYVYQHWDKLDRTVDLNAPSVFDRTNIGQTRTVAAADATRPIVPVNGGVRQVNVLMNLGVSDYHALQTLLSYRGHPKFKASLSYTLSKATNTTEPDGNGIGPNQSNLARLGEDERGPSLVDQRHRAVIALTYLLPYNVTVGTVTQLASARPFNAVTGVDNNGDGANNDRPVVNGSVISKSSFRGTGTQDVSAFAEARIGHWGGSRTLVVRLEGFNLFNHGNFLGRAQTTYGNTDTINATFGQLVAAGTATNAIPALANIDPPRMFQVQVRVGF